MKSLREETAQKTAPFLAFVEIMVASAWCLTVGVKGLDTKCSAQAMRVRELLDNIHFIWAVS